MAAESLALAILEELEHQGATEPEDAVDVIALRHTLGALQLDFDTAVAELADLEQVGLVIGKIYLRRNV
ncbi:hypothetical protein [Solirhodobacter olei]|uniref:hypothetical protein n=1 Tax=Solirhodobacter olei TaxID=2493082 RepID=UPI000FD81231|nr:hypothetical protein [Solirhodobacter olei]